MTESRQLGTMSKATLLILLSLIFVSNGCSFGKRGRTRVHRSDDECVCATAVRYNPLTDTNITVDPHCDCRSSGFGVVRMIPYGTCGGTMHVDLSSACVRCSMCVAVAEEVRRISNVFSTYNNPISKLIANCHQIGIKFAHRLVTNPCLCQQ